MHERTCATGTPLLAWVGFLWVLLSASYGGFAVRFFPEVMVGFLIVALSMRLWRTAIEPPQRRAWYFSGLLLGILVMFKATFYYLAPILALALSVHAAKRNVLPLRSAAILGLVFLAGTLTLRNVRTGNGRSSSSAASVAASCAAGSKSHGPRVNFSDTAIA